MDLGDTAYKVCGVKKLLWKFMELTETSSQVNEPLVHLTLFFMFLEFCGHLIGIHARAEDTGHRTYIMLLFLCYLFLGGWIPSYPR